MDVRCLSPLKSHCKSNNAFSEKKEAPKSKTIEYLLTQNKIVVLLYTKRKVLKFFPSGQKENLHRKKKALLFPLCYSSEENFFRDYRYPNPSFADFFFPSGYSTFKVVKVGVGKYRQYEAHLKVET